MTGLTWYTNIRKKYFGNIFINPGIIEDQVEYAIWRLDIYCFSHHYKMLLYSVTNSIKTPLMISLKVWLPLLQFLKTSPVTLILSVEYSAAINVFFLTMNEVKDLLKISVQLRIFILQIKVMDEHWIMAHWILGYFICTVLVSMSNSSIYQPIVTSVPYASPIRIQLQPFPFIYQIFAILILRFNLFLQILKYNLISSLFSSKICTFCY